MVDQASGETLLESIESEIEDLEKFEINPNFYSHIVITQILKAPQLALINGHEETAMTSLIFGVDQLERICKANKILDKDYDEQIKKESEEIKKEKEGTVKTARLANVKLQFLLEAIFKHRMRRTEPII